MTCSPAVSGEQQRERGRSRDGDAAIQSRAFLPDCNGALGRNVLKHCVAECRTEQRNRAQVAFQHARKSAAQSVRRADFLNDVRKTFGIHSRTVDVADAALLFQKTHELGAIICAHAFARVDDDAANSFRRHRANVPIQGLCQVKRVGASEELIKAMNDHVAVYPTSGASPLGPGKTQLALRRPCERKPAAMPC